VLQNCFWCVFEHKQLIDGRKSAWVLMIHFNTSAPLLRQRVGLSRFANF
jgi:hypothetical protein